MRHCALTLALLHPDALVGYCMYNKCQLTPQQILQLHGPHVPQGDMSFTKFLQRLRHMKFVPFFFSDELEYLYEQRITAPLDQVCLAFGNSGTGDCDFLVILWFIASHSCRTWVSVVPRCPS